MSEVAEEYINRRLPDAGSNRNPEFQEIINEIIQIHDTKNKDYADDTDPLLNFMQCEAMGIPAWHGVETRLCDKNQRVHGFIKRGGGLAVKDESIEDTMKDRIVYDIIALMLYRRYRKTQEESNAPSA